MDLRQSEDVGYKWSGCCYKGSEDGDCMRNKPLEIMNQTKYHMPAKGRKLVDNLSLSTGIAPSLSQNTHSHREIPHGFEISIGPKDNQRDFADYDNATAEESLKLWKSSPKHHDVIVNNGKWKDVEWKKIGAAAYGPFANVWVSE